MKNKFLKFIFSAIFAMFISNVCLAQKTAEDYLKLGEEQLSASEQNDDGAIRSFTECLRLKPGSYECYFWRAAAYINKMNYDSAIADLTQAIKLRPKHPGYYRRRADLYYYNLKNYDMAIADLTQAIRLNPQDSSYYAHRGRAFLAKQNYEAAIADITQAINLTLALKSDPSYNYEYRAKAYCALGKTDLALADERKASEAGINISSPCQQTAFSPNQAASSNSQTTSSSITPPATAAEAFELAKRHSAKNEPACNLSLKDAPTVRGLKLGMTLKQVEDLVGERLTLNNNLTSVSEAKSRTTINVGEKQALLGKFKGANFEGVLVLQLKFFNDILSGFEIISDTNTKWENSSKFIDYVSNTFKLPRNAWKEDYPNSVLSCKEFSLGANISGWSNTVETLLITNSIIADRLKKLANDTYLKGLNNQ